MEKLLLKDISEFVKGKLIKGEPSIVISGITTDSRKVKDGDLYIPLKGDRFDGHDFLHEAKRKGAKAILVSKSDLQLPQGLAVVYVDDTLKALQYLSYNYRKMFNIPVVAVTGSTGKTTTKDMIYALLSTKYNVLKTEGNLNNHIGLPLSLLNLERNHDIAVLEMGMSGFGEIRLLAELALPTIGVVTNIGMSHIEKLGSKENILKAKIEMFEAFNEQNTAVLNGDDEMLWRLKGHFPFPVKYYGTRDGATYKAEDVSSSSGQYVSYILNDSGKRYRIELNIPGTHNVYNSLAAITVARTFDIDYDMIKQALLDLKPQKMRQNRISLSNNVTLIDDCYNASPDSMAAAISLLENSDGNRKIAIIGDMLELGEFTEEAHIFVADTLSKAKVDIIITKGEKASMIGNYLLLKGFSVDKIHIKDFNHEVNQVLDTLIEKGDTILIKGSRGMKMEEIVGFVAERWHK